MGTLRCHLTGSYDSTVLSRIYAPRFTTLVLVESIGGGGASYAGSDILSREYAPSSAAMPRC